MSEHEQARKMVRETRDFWRGHATTETRATKLADALEAALDQEERLERRIEDLEESNWPWEWVIATRERERWKRAEQENERLREALKEAHEFQCGCSQPGNSSVCVATPVYTFSILSTEEQG